MYYFLPADIVNQTLNFGLPAPYDIQFVGRDRQQNQIVAANLADKIRHIPGAVDVRIQQPFGQPAFKINVDRLNASQVGLSERDVANSVMLSLSGNSQVQPSYWLNQGVQYKVNIRVPEYNIGSLAQINSIPLSGGGKINTQLLANVALSQRTSVAPIYSHYNVQPVIDVYGGVSDRDLGGVLNDVKPLVAAAEKELSPGNFIIMRGQAETMNSSMRGLILGLILAIILVYLLLVVNFQSWLDPVIIIVALPGAMAGVVWGLYLSFTTLSVPALMGAIMAMGVATANSVLVVTFARNNLKKGIASLEAAWEAGTGRLRPVLMTALAMIIGMFPLALGLGQGGEQNAPLGRAVIGGLVVATVATLFIVPLVFSLLHRNTRIENTENIIPPANNED